ncbi:MAG: ABC transporter permease [Bacteroidetes bacterium]|nr:ABC transporter permease [Bacteroidota bacterium]
MFKNYFKIAVRHHWKTKGYSFLNIAGLAIGIACAGLIFLWVEDEVTYDQYYSNNKNIYKVKNSQTYDGTTFVFDATPGPLAQSMKADIPGIKTTARTTWGNRVLFSLDDKTIYEQGLYVDSGFFSIFHFRFLKGNAANPFPQLHSLVVTSDMAEKFFGTTDIVGKTLKVNNEQDYVITAVIKDLPENASFNKVHWFSPFRIYGENNQWLQEWGNNGIITYVQTEDNTNSNSINKKLVGYVKSRNKEANSEMSIYPNSRWRLYDSFDKNGAEKEGRIRYVKLFSLIAWIILIIACINFMNLATARSEQRAREVGVRKVLGAVKSKLIFQFLAESLIMTFISALVAVVIMYFTLPAFNNLVEKHLSLNLLAPLHIISLLVIVLISGLLAGSYPAFYLSSFNPVMVLKKLKLKNGAGAGFIRKSLVVIQFSVSVILIICTVIIYQQIRHTKDRDLGFNKNNLVFMSLQGKLKDNFTPIKNELLQSGIAENASLSSSDELQYGSNSGDFSWDGKDPGKQLLVSMVFVSPEHLSTAGMKLKEGRDFYPNAAADSNNVIINETLAKAMKTKNVIGSIISWGDEGKYTVVGVVKDFIYNNVYTDPAPLIFFCNPGYANYLSIRFRPDSDIRTALSGMESIIKKYNPGYPVEYNFVDDVFDMYFKGETLVGKLAAVFAVLAIIISCLGLFGLSAFTAENRIKEIGIRKVLGASTGGLATLLSKDFIRMVFISCIIAFPIAWWVMHSWLQDFEYRVAISWWIFFGAGLLALLIALVTVSFQAVKAAIANPVKSLRME